MKIDRNNLILLVHDNGKGIADENIDRKKSFGITGMKERVELLGGKFTIHGTKGKGTLLSAEIPLPSK
jgi:two-component system sensor histidine kinase DegS